MQYLIFRAYVASCEALGKARTNFSPKSTESTTDSEKIVTLSLQPLRPYRTDMVVRTRKLGHGQQELEIRYNSEIL